MRASTASLPSAPIPQMILALQARWEQVRSGLWNHGNGGGLARYEGELLTTGRPEGPGNPWFVTTLWLAQYDIARATTKEELEKALALLDWVAGHALPSGVLAEQIHPKAGSPSPSRPSPGATRPTSPPSSNTCANALLLLNSHRRELQNSIWAQMEFCNSNSGKKILG